MTAGGNAPAGAAAGVPAAPAAPARDVPDGVRGAFVAAALLLLWIRLPFHDLAAPPDPEVFSGGALTSQITFSLLGLAVAAVLHRIGWPALRPLASRPLVLAASWFAVTVALSVSPGLSLRRAVLLAIAVAAAAAIMLAARTPRQFAGFLAGTALAVVVASLLALVLVPDLATHTARDLRETEHAGDWRGLFPHKNEAGAIMAVFVLVGLFAWGVGHRALGGTLCVLAAVFLAGTTSKTPAAVLPLVLVATGLCRAVRGSTGRALLLLGPLTLLLTVSLGSLFVPTVHDLVAAVLPDTSFTGRSEIWDFAAQHILQRPITGWGFGAFWNSQRTLYAGSETLTWVNQADQAHNGYLDTALIMGFPGLALTVLALVIAPFGDFIAVTRLGPPDATAVFFLRLWLFGLATAAFESVFYDASSGLFPMVMVAVLGLRLLAAHGPAPSAAP